MVSGLSHFAFWEREAEDRVTAIGWRETGLLVSWEFVVPVFVQPAPADWRCAHCEKGSQCCGILVSTAYQVLCAGVFPGLLHSHNLRNKVLVPVLHL